MFVFVLLSPGRVLMACERGRDKKQERKTRLREKRKRRGSSAVNLVGEDAEDTLQQVRILLERGSYVCRYVEELPDREIARKEAPGMEKVTDQQCRYDEPLVWEEEQLVVMLPTLGIEVPTYLMEHEI
jgi:hypothetical protein